MSEYVLFSFIHPIQGSGVPCRGRGQGPADQIFRGKYAGKGDEENGRLVDVDSYILILSGARRLLRSRILVLKQAARLDATVLTVSV